MLPVIECETFGPVKLAQSQRGRTKNKGVQVSGERLAGGQVIEGAEERALGNFLGEAVFDGVGQR